MAAPELRARLIRDVANDTLLFLGHDLSPASREAYARLRQGAGQGRQVRWLLDMASHQAVPHELAGEVETFDSRQFASWGLATMGATLLPGHCHFPLLNYFRAHPETRRLWVVEYDVRFTGTWNAFFDHFEGNGADLLACHLRTPQQEPRWHWWPSLQAPDGTRPPADLMLRAFMVVARFSAAALSLLAARHGEGWRGHQEVIAPTLLRMAGLSVQDINAPDGAPSRRFYTSSTNEKGKVKGLFSTLRYRPARHRAGWRRNMLYHPVKPAPARPPV